MFEGPGKGPGPGVLGLHLSPRRGGSSWALLQSFLEGAEGAGARTKVLSVADLRVGGCTGCYSCEGTGRCAIEGDDMGLVYEAWEAASRIVVSSPIFFYDIPSQGKAILDRSQAFWVRRYRLGRGKGTKPGAKGFLLAVGATKGEQLFVPITLAVRYLFDAISFPKGFGTLFFRGIEGPSDLSLGQLGEARDAGAAFAAP